jgi:hypothetical protein
MEFPVIIAVSAILIIGVLFLVARRALRLVVRLAIVGMLVLVLLAIGLAWWWYGSGNTPASKPYGGSPSGTRRSTSR